MSDKSTQASDPADAMLRCSHCDRPYREHGCDLTLPDEQWEAVFGNTGGVLCGTCICKRAAQLPGAVAIRAHIEFATPTHAQRQDAQPAAPSAQATGEPLPCPFCGQPPTVKRRNFNQKVNIGCDACHYGHRADSFPKALRAWNRRTQPAGAAVEAVAKLIRPCPPGKGVIQKFPTKTGATTVIPNENALLLPPGEYDLYAASPQQRSGQDGVDDAMVARLTKFLHVLPPFFQEPRERVEQIAIAALTAALANPPAPAPGEGS